MGLFREFVNQCEQAEMLVEDFNNAQGSTKVWSASKSEIIQMWKNIQPNTPIIAMPMEKKQDGHNKSYGEDGVRITGSWPFIAGILARLKELTVYENPQTKMRLILRGVNRANDARPDRNSFVFYFNLERRGSRKVGRPRNQTNLTPALPKV